MSELLLPAGSIEKMRYAFHYGADACYLGLVDFSLRTMRKGDIITKDNLKIATKIARDMITVYGMNEKIGPISLKKDEPYEDLMMGEDIENVIGEEVKKMVSIAYVTAQKILLENMDILHAVAKTLIEKEKISGEEFESFFVNRNNNS